METIKYYFNLFITTYGNFLFNFFLNLLHHSILKNLNEAYLYFIVATLTFLIMVISFIIPAGILSCLIETLFCPGNTFEEKYKSFIEKRRIKIAKNTKEWPNSFGYRYMNQLSYIMILTGIISSIISKSFDILWFGLPFIILAVIHDHRIKKMFKYELYIWTDLCLYFIAIYISAFVFVHFCIHHILK